MLSRNSKKILFIAHEASYTGAPVLLLNLLKLLKEDGKVDLDLIIARGGPLEKAFTEVSKSVVLKKEGYSSLPKGLKWGRYFLLNKINTLQMFFKAFNSDIIFANSVVTARLVKMLRFTRKPALIYVHELEKVLAFYTAQKSGTYFLENTDRFVYPGEMVKNLLKDTYGIGGERLKKLSYYIPFHQTEEITKTTRPAAGEFIVCGIGNASLRKGTDIFIEVAKRVCEQNDVIKFVWVGPFETEALKKEWTDRVIGYGLQDKFSFTGPYHPDEMKKLYGGFDLLFLSSREDPYPLVVLEAGYCELPSLIFKPAGGITEFVEDDAGWSLEDFSVEKAAQQIIDISQHRDAIAPKGAKAKERVMEWHMNKQLILDQFYAAIDNIPVK